MPRLSANLGFLWADLALPDAIRAAAQAGFDAVECHWPYACDADQVRAALDETGLAMLGLNTLRGAPGENGLAALPGREVEARAAIEQAFHYADRIGCKAVHVMAGFAEGPLAEAAFNANLKHACDLAARQGATDRVIGAPTHDEGVAHRRGLEVAEVLGQVPRHRAVGADDAVAAQGRDQGDAGHGVNARSAGHQTAMGALIDGSAT